MIRSEASCALAPVQTAFAASPPFAPTRVKMASSIRIVSSTGRKSAIVSRLVLDGFLLKTK